MSELRELTVRDTCRIKLPVFYGSRDNYLHGFREVIANGCDEISNNFDTGTITVWLHEDNKTITVKDTGRGMPVEEVTDGKKNYVLLFETLFASTNYDNFELGKTTTGQNGVGLTVLNYSSKKFIVEVGRNGFIYRVSYKNGGEFEGFEKIGQTNETYTELTFVLDDEVYTKSTYEIQDIKDIVKAVAGVTNDVNFIVHYGEEREEYFYNEVIDYFNDIATKLTAYNLNTTVKLDNEHLQYLEIVLNTAVEPVQQTFLNRTHLIQGGTIHEGVINGVRLFINRLIKDNKKYQKLCKGVTLDDIRGSISFVVDCLSTAPEFSNQTKFSTEKNEYKAIVQRIVQDLLSQVYNNKPKDLEKFINHIITVAKFNEDSGKTKAKLQKKLNENIEKPNNRVARLVDCKYHGPESELYIAEGLSALGSIILARDAVYQACYPLSGKILNCLKADFEQIFKNEVITDLIKVLGCGTTYKDLFNINNLRFGKIIIATDQDSDGFDIQTLALTMFYRLMPQLITDGYVYIANTPLYEVRLKDDTMVYWYSEEEKKREISKYDNIDLISRAKGLGELQPEVMAETAMNRETRKLTQVTVDMLDLEKMYSTFDLWMGTEVEPRKEYIEENLNGNFDYSETEIVPQLEINELLTDAKMSYSKYIIEERFLCDYRDGLKPVHRRILWTMKKDKAFSFIKCNTISGSVMKYHPHGDCYDTMVNLTQTDKQLIPLIVGKGNFGQNTSRDMQYAHQRYTECKLSEIAKDMLQDVDKHMVKMISNYDGTLTLPEVLPVKFPAILAYANSGIGVGMSSTSASFNLGEICDVIVEFLETGERNALFPDFATGGYLVVDEEQIRDINVTGNGTLTLLAKHKVIDNTIQITEIPYGKTREAIVDRIIKLIEQGKLPHIDTVKDLTGLKGMNIEIVIKRSKKSLMKSIINQLYDLTPLRSTYTVNMRMLVDGLPKVMGVWDTIEKWLEWRRECIVNGIKYEIGELNKVLNLLQGFVKIIECIDEIIECIKNSTEAEVTPNLMSQFNLNFEQAEYIGNMKLRKLNKEYLQSRILELTKIEQKISKLQEITQDMKLVDEIIINDMKETKNKFGHERRTLFVD